MVRLLFFFILMSLLGCMVSCNSSERTRNDIEKSSPIDNAGGPEKHAAIEFTDDFVDLGSIHEGEVIAYTFSFKNKGSVPLVVKDVIAGCGCTKTNLSSKLVKPNESATLEVVFDSKGWSGSQYKSVTIVSNALTEKRSVTIKVNVVV